MRSAELRKMASQPQTQILCKRRVRKNSNCKYSGFGNRALNEQNGRIVCIFLCSIPFSSVALHFTPFVTSIIILSSHLVDPPHYMRRHFVNADDSRCVLSLSLHLPQSLFIIQLFQCFNPIFFINSSPASPTHRCPCIVASEFSLSQIYDFHFHFRAANV